MTAANSPSIIIQPFRQTFRAPLLDAINAVCNEGCWMRTIRYEPTPDWDHALAEPDCLCHRLLLVLDGPRVVGWCRLFPESGTGASLGIGLLPEYRDRGYGTVLLQQAINWASAGDLEWVGLQTRPDNARAIHVFEKMGFAAHRVSESGWLDMELDLCACSRDRKERTV